MGSKFSEHTQTGGGRPFRIDLPDPLRCEPSARRAFGGRNRIHPIYTSAIVYPSDLTAASGLGQCGDRSTATFREARIASNDNGQAVTFHLKQSSHSSLSAKNGRLSSGLGPHERAWAMELEADPFWVDYEMQGSTVHLAGDDEDASYRADWIAVDWDGMVHAGELKAHYSHYLDPAYDSKLSAAGRAFGKIGISFRRDTGDTLRRNPRRTLNVVRAYADAFTSISDRQRDAISEAFAREGSETALGRIQDALGGTLAAEASTRAALCQRLISYDLNLRVGRDTVVTVPPTPTTVTDIRAIDVTVTL